MLKYLKTYIIHFFVITAVYPFLELHISQMKRSKKGVNAKPMMIPKKNFLKSEDTHLKVLLAADLQKLGL